MTDFNDMMAGLTAELSHMVKESYKAPETFREHFAAFRAAVDWSEQWIQGLMAFHVVIFIMFLILRNNVDFQTALFLLICLLVGLSERINTFCAKNWQNFSKQNYFDEHGTFASTLFSGPLLVIGFAMLINFLRLTSSALIKAKRLELAAKKKTKKENESKKEK